MNKHTLYGHWAPPQSIWSPWVKAAPFAYLEGEVRPPDVSIASEFDFNGVPEPSERFAIMLDLPGPAAVAAAITLATRGYRPVSLFNACPPWPVHDWPDGPSMISAVDVNAQLRALAASAETLASLSLQPDAPPAFIIEADRAAERRFIGPGMWDNRSMLFVSDLPSATFLRNQRITRALWVHAEKRTMNRDLLQALGSWQKEGVEIYQTTIGPTQSIERLRISSPSFLSTLRLRFTAIFSLRRNPRGGYGAFWPESSGG